jgi:hypothetical protein
VRITGLDTHASPGVHFRVLGCERRTDGGQLRARRGAVEPRPKAAEDAEEPRIPLGCGGVERERRPELRVSRPERREAESLGHHAHHRVALAVEGDAPADDARIAAEAPRPQLVAEDDDVIAPRPAVVRGEGATEGWPDAEKIE